MIDMLITDRYEKPYIKPIKILLVVDYQNDFVAENGLLTCGKAAQDIEENICKAIRETIASGGRVTFTMDWHSSATWEIHRESILYPRHCIEDTEGAQLYGKIPKLVEDLLIEYPQAKFFYVKKDSFCAPKGLFPTIAMSSTELSICGVATNVCVLQNAIALYNTSVYNKTNNFLSVIENCCASFDTQAHHDAINYMTNILGFEKINV